MDKMSLFEKDNKVNLKVVGRKIGPRLVEVDFFDGKVTQSLRFGITNEGQTAFVSKVSSDHCKLVGVGEEGSLAFPIEVEVTEGPLSGQRFYPDQELCVAHDRRDSEYPNWSIYKGYVEGNGCVYQVGNIKVHSHWTLATKETKEIFKVTVLLNDSTILFEI